MRIIYPLALLRWGLCSSSCSIHFDEHKYCNKGTRYLPQKSTNFICSTRLSKKTPLHLGFTQQFAQFKYSNVVWGTSPGWTSMPVDLTILAANSISVGGVRAISCTKRTTKGLSRRLSWEIRKLRIYFYIRHLSIKYIVYTSAKFFNATISLGKCFKRFLCNSNDLRVFKRAILVGRLSIRLSHSTKACSWLSKPTDSGTSVIKFPPMDRTWRLEGEQRLIINLYIIHLQEIMIYFICFWINNIVLLQ